MSQIKPPFNKLELRSIKTQKTDPIELAEIEPVIHHSSQICEAVTDSKCTFIPKSLESNIESKLSSFKYALFFPNQKGWAVEGCLHQKFNLIPMSHTFRQKKCLK